MEKKAKIEKVNIEKLIESLVYVYNMGSDFVDIIIKSGEHGNQDKITVVVRDEYLIDRNDAPPSNESVRIVNEKDIDNFFDEIS